MQPFTLLMLLTGYNMLIRNNLSRRGKRRRPSSRSYFRTWYLAQGHFFFKTTLPLISNNGILWSRGYNLLLFKDIFVVIRILTHRFKMKKNVCWMWDKVHVRWDGLKYAGIHLWILIALRFPQLPSNLKSYTFMTSPQSLHPHIPRGPWQACRRLLPVEARKQFDMGI